MSINELGVNEPNIIKTLLPAISKRPSEKMIEQGKEIIKNFAPLLESSNSALVNGTKRVLAELNPGFKEHTDGGRKYSIRITKSNQT
ncbi:hypothetical protein [Rickettsia fournieri]|uniref:hypothetical protein n=1 Tax=Rickettsia fournieri TaxID=1436798 RepID=UPI000CDEA5A8|nr:hypothetical protein [Rickettsia fournieri]